MQKGIALSVGQCLFCALLKTTTSFTCGKIKAEALIVNKRTSFV